jgi:RHS repeat-associated protein
MACLKLKYLNLPTNLRIVYQNYGSEAPFNLSSKSTWCYRYGFNGMERDDEIRGKGNSYDYGARMYDPRIARFFSIDPLSYEFPYWSPYLYAANDPIRMIDVYGMGPGDRVKAARSLLGKPYSQESGGLRTGMDQKSLANMDCSEFVCRVLAADKITPKVESMNSTKLREYLGNEQKFVHSTNNPKVGDVAVWEGHVGIVTSVKDGKIKLAHARGAGKLSSENPYHITPGEYRSSKFYGYYRPISESDEGKDVIDVNEPVTEKVDDNIYYGGTLSTVNVETKSGVPLFLPSKTTTTVSSKLPDTPEKIISETAKTISSAL